MTVTERMQQLHELEKTALAIFELPEDPEKNLGFALLQQIQNYRTALTARLVKDHLAMLQQRQKEADEKRMEKEGPERWQELHLYTLDEPQDEKAIKDWLTAWLARIPCGVCKAEGQGYIKNN